ncbi:UNVERIFIED_CONTAM: hypothetical protein FKN15_073944 [Acipenser sinensis]
MSDPVRHHQKDVKHRSLVVFSLEKLRKPFNGRVRRVKLREAKNKKVDGSEQYT